MATFILIKIATALFKDPMLVKKKKSFQCNDSKATNVGRFIACRSRAGMQQRPNYSETI